MLLSSVLSGAIASRHVARILITVHKFFPQHRAGTEVLVLKIAQELIVRQHQVLVVAANPPDTDARFREGEEIKTYTYEGIDVVSFEEPLRLRGYKFSYEFQHPRMRESFSAVLDQFNPDLVHVVHAQNLSGSIIEETKARGLPLIISPTDFWFICPIVQLKRPDGTVCQGPGVMGKNCFNCYTPELLPPEPEFKEALLKRFPNLIAADKAPQSDVLSRLLYWAYISTKWPKALRATSDRPAVLKEIANMADAITVPTKLMKRLFIENGIKEDLIHQVPFGIDTSKLVSWCDKTPSPVMRIGFIGTLFEHKGVDILIRAFQSLKEPEKAVVKVYGNPTQFPDYFDKLKQLAESDVRTRERILFLGTFPNDSFGKVLSELDVLVVPSRWYENTPLVMQSALATKTPLIATNLGGMSELIEHEKTGLLFGLNDHLDLCRQLEELIGQPGRLDMFRKNIGPQRTVEDMVDDLERLYRSALSPGVLSRTETALKH